MISLGIHVGHDSSCAIVVDGILAAAIQAERLSRKKHQAILSLSDDLPVQAALDAAGVRIQDVDVIVTSIQWAGPGGFGLHRALIDPGFSLFDPWADRHRVLSHHLAHAHSTFEASAFTDAAVLVCDYAGSPTVDGKDYAQPFKRWYEHLTSFSRAIAPQVEFMSLYRASRVGGYHLLDRRFNIAHPGQGSFVYSVAGLYDNVSRYVIGQTSAQGELMALAAYGSQHSGAAFDPGPLVQLADADEVIYRNDWQHALPEKPDFSLRSCLAWRCQEATEIALLAAGKRATRLAGSANLAVAGGVFLNILANSRLATSGACSAYHVPSAPHDAGISVGCAFHGARLLGGRPRPVTTDRLGRRYSAGEVEKAIRKMSAFVQARPLEHREVIHELNTGRIVARWAGRAEFGPRALGGRSLLASPRFEATKAKLNQIKGREAWRPVAPVVPKEDFSAFFDGPDQSNWMTMSQLVRVEHRAALPALRHPDGSTRAQTLLREQDEQLHSWLKELGAVCGYPILVNTSFNRKEEPIVETAADAIAMFLDKSDIDWLILEDRIVSRIDPLQHLSGAIVRLPSDTFLTQHFMGLQRVVAVSNGIRTWRVSDSMYDLLTQLGREPVQLRRIVEDVHLEQADLEQIRMFLVHGLIAYPEECA